MPLNIDLQQIFLHLFNFVILFAVLYFLLYKPVKDFMEKRTEYYKKIDDEAKAKLADSEKIKTEYINKLAAADSEIFAAKEKARTEAKSSADAKIKNAEEEAGKIIADAKKNAEAQREKILCKAQSEVADMALCAAEKLATAASTSDSFDIFLAAAKRGVEDE